MECCTGNTYRVCKLRRTHYLACMDFWYKQERPLLTASAEEALTSAFARPLPLREAYAHLVPEELRLEYSFEAFEGDLAYLEPPLEQRSQMTLVEAQAFMEQMQ